MGDESQMMIVRPRNCNYCGHGYYGLQHVVDYAMQVGAWDVTDMQKEQANKEPIYAAIDQTDPYFFYGFGHGNDCIFTGDSELGIFTCDECDKLGGRVVYLLSCLTANRLGPAIMENGGVTYAGYDISWTWISDSDPDGDNDPYDDPYAFCFWESGNELWMALIDGLEFHKCIDAAIDMYNAWIDYWLYDNPEDPYATECIKWLVHDRNGLVGLPGGGARGIPVAAIVAAVAVVGIAYIAVK